MSNNILYFQYDLHLPVLTVQSYRTFKCNNILVVQAPYVFWLMDFLGTHDRTSNLLNFKTSKTFLHKFHCHNIFQSKFHWMTTMSEKPTAVSKASSTVDATSSAFRSLNPASEALLNEKVNQYSFEAAQTNSLYLNKNTLFPNFLLSLSDHSCNRVD